MQALPAVCQPVLPEAAAASSAASPDAPASSKKHEREQEEVRCAFCHESEEMTLAPSLSRALNPNPDPDPDPICSQARAPALNLGPNPGQVLCAFCHEGLDSDDPDDDPLVPIETGRAKQHYAHENCIWWCPDVWQDKDLKWQNVGKALSRCHRLKVVRVRVSYPHPHLHPCPCPYL